ncbi:MAG: hypothetical protein Q4Q18_08355 [Methanobrevibacter sp.]|nr:hypothetical protein [Methanobrevibacter sp.]
MKLKRVIVISLLILAVLTVGSVSANDNLTGTVELSDEVMSLPQEDILGESDDGTFNALYEKIDNAEAGSTITLENNYANTDDFDSEGIVIDKDLTINGNGYTIDGLSSSRIFKIKDCTVTLNNIKFTNGHAIENDAKHYFGSGGAIYAVSTALTVNSCTFTNNMADLHGGAIFSSSYEHTLTINSCTFTGNVAKATSGAVDASCIGLQITDSTFNQNSAGSSGGAISSLSWDGNGNHLKDTITNCIFTNNRAGSHGGAIRIDSKLSIASSTFTNNDAGACGGALYTNEDLTVTNSRFTKNHASENGGAIHAQGYNLEVINGVRKITYYNVLIQDSTFSSNVANEVGGAIAATTYGAESTYPKVVRSTFTGNKAKDSNDISGFVATNCKFDAAPAKIKLTLKSVKVKKSAKKLVLTATLKKGSKALKGKKITFKFNGKKFTAKTNKKGVAKVTIKKKVLKKLKVGKKVKYQASYGKLTVKKSAKVKK